jgi:hypothetical protein
MYCVRVPRYDDDDDDDDDEKIMVMIFTFIILVSSPSHIITHYIITHLSLITTFHLYHLHSEML